MSDPSGGQPFEFARLPMSSRRMHRAKKRPSPQWVMLGIGLVLLAVALGAVIVFSRQEAPTLALQPIPDVTIDELGTLRVPVKIQSGGNRPGRLHYSLRGAPKGVQIDPKTGLISGGPAEDASPGTYTLIVRADADSGLSAQRSFRVTIRRMKQPPLLDAIDEKVVAPGGKETFSTRAGGPADAAEKNADGALVESGLEPAKDGAGASAAKVAKEPSPNAKADAKADAKPDVKTEAKADAKTPATDPGDAVILELYRKNKLLAKTEYAKLRKVFADRFEAKHQEVIRRALGESDGELRQWLDRRADIKEELYLAIDPQHDDVPRVLTLFKELRERFPQKFESYASLAIAVAVVWDKEHGAIHGSPTGQHQSVVPEGQVGALENFKYYLDAEAVMQGRAQFLPWEFLVHVVNHRTPLRERQWALANYLPKRSMIGKCYSDVPYDHGMLQGLDPRLKGKPHTLPNQREYGGVCGCQADYATRVAKSLGVPAFTASAANKYGDAHAWVMWAELGPVTRTGFAFSLESHGRYRDDLYYVGQLHDPHTGQSLSDRQMELRLHTVGMDPIAKRQADLVMRSYPMLREADAMEVPHQLRFLTRVIEFCPGGEEAWKTLARLSKEGQITKANSKPMLVILDRLLATFKNVPDFTWVVFEDMVAFEDRPKQRAALFARLAALYEQPKRIDLACEARLKSAECLLADGRSAEAVDALAATILRFPDEGRYVPKMLDKLEEICRKDKRSQEPLVRFYQQFLPKIPQKRGSAPSPYCMEMYKRGIERFKEAGRPQLVQMYQVQLAALEASKPSKR